jgi:acyl-CoA thioester hydrolase
MQKVTMKYRVPYADTDQMQVVYYGNYLTYFERIRNEVLRSTGFSYRQLEETGYTLPVKEAHVNYYAPASYDDLLEISGWCGMLRGVKLTIHCEVRRDNKLLADGHTLHVCCDLKTMKPVRPPDHLMKLIANL